MGDIRFVPWRPGAVDRWLMHDTCVPSLLVKVFLAQPIYYIMTYRLQELHDLHTRRSATDLSESAATAANARRRVPEMRAYQHFEERGKIVCALNLFKVAQL